MITTEMRHLMGIQLKQEHTIINDTIRTRVGELQHYTTLRKQEVSGLATLHDCHQIAYHRKTFMLLTVAEYRGRGYPWKKWKEEIKETVNIPLCEAWSELSIPVKMGVCPLNTERHIRKETRQNSCNLSYFIIPLYKPNFNIISLWHVQSAVVMTHHIPFVYLCTNY